MRDLLIYQYIVFCTLFGVGVFALAFGIATSKRVEGKRRFLRLRAWPFFSSIFALFVVAIAIPIVMEVYYMDYWMYKNMPGIQRQIQQQMQQHKS